MPPLIRSDVPLVRSGAIADKHEKVRQMGYCLNSKHKDHANADGKMAEAQKCEYLKDYEAKFKLLEFQRP